MSARKEFEIRILDTDRLRAAQNLSGGFSALLDMVEAAVPAGRERSIVVTKLQEAFGWALRGVTGGGQ